MHSQVLKEMLIRANGHPNAAQDLRALSMVFHTKHNSAEDDRSALWEVFVPALFFRFFWVVQALLPLKSSSRLGGVKHSCMLPSSEAKRKRNPSVATIGSTVSRPSAGTGIAGGRCRRGTSVPSHAVYENI